MFQEMGFGAFRGMIRPLARTLVSRTSPTPFSAPKPEFRFGIGGGGLRQGRSLWAQVSQHFSIFAELSHFDRLTDTRFPKRRPLDKPRRKRASLRPPGPYAWTQYVPGEPIQPNNPNEGSLKRRKEKKRMRQRRAFILAEAKKRRAQLQEAKRKKNIQRIERKMAAVAREREWAQRLAELQKLEEEKKKIHGLGVPCST